jgi:hypothetical protein
VTRESGQDKDKTNRLGKNQEMKRVPRRHVTPPVTKHTQQTTHTTNIGLTKTESGLRKPHRGSDSSVNVSRTNSFFFPAQFLLVRDSWFVVPDDTDLLSQAGKAVGWDGINCVLFSISIFLRSVLFCYSVLVFAHSTDVRFPATPSVSLSVNRIDGLDRDLPSVDLFGHQRRTGCSQTTMTMTTATLDGYGDATGLRLLIIT